MSRPGNYSQNDNQNYFSDQNGRTSSKVLKPPGGGSSIQLGWDTSNDRTDNVGKATVKHGGRNQMPYHAEVRKKGRGITLGGAKRHHPTNS